MEGNAEDSREEGEHQPEGGCEGSENFEQPPKGGTKAEEAMENAETKRGAQAGVVERHEEGNPGDGREEPPADGWENEDDKNRAQEGEENLTRHRGLIESEVGI